MCRGRCPNLSCVNFQHPLCLKDLTPHQAELFCTSMNNTSFTVFRKLTLQMSSSFKYILRFGLESPIALLAPLLPGCPGLLNFTTFHIALQSSAACIATCRFRGLPHFGDQQASVPPDSVRELRKTVTEAVRNGLRRVSYHL